jgi:hypothetical protein
MYDKDVVTDYLFDAEEQPEDSLKTSSKKLFLKGIDLYKNKKQADSSIPYFKQSILTYPDAKTYYELGNALMDGQANTRLNYIDQAIIREADSAINVAQSFHFEPMSQLYYDKACIVYLLRFTDTDYAVPVDDYLEQAFADGFTDTTFLNNDKRINGFTKRNEYRKLIAEQKARQVAGKGKSMFDTYIQSFPTVVQPFEITLDKVNMKDYSSDISYDFAKFIPEMGNTRFGRGVDNDYIYVAKVAQTPVYVAVIYFSINYYDEGEMQPILTKLVTYDTAGNIISSRLFAYQYSMEKIRAGRIDNNEITLQDYKRIWKYRIDSVSIEDNQVLRYEPLTKATFRLTESGKIEKDDVPANFNDSATTAALR